MWADTLFAAERQHVLSLGIWAVAAMLIGGSVYALFVRPRQDASPLLHSFALQLAAIGTLVLLLAVYRWGGLRMRDIAAATQLERATWFGAGLEMGLALAGVMLAAAGWWISRRLALVGAGVALATHAAALLVLDLRLLAVLAR
jgi:hypothetical protein